MSEDKGIWIITNETPEQESETEEVVRGIKSPGRGYSYDDPREDAARLREIRGGDWNRIESSELQSNMNQFLEVLGQTFDQAERSNSKMQLDEVELTVEINGKGQVGLLGTGGEVGGKGAIKLKFKRNNG
ncbi:MAG: hypothetical protein AAGA80_10425 [Cyanobacteria bacterium P01_F01_bin.143]